MAGDGSDGAAAATTTAQDATSRTCVVCGKPAQFQCSQCGITNNTNSNSNSSSYCSQECQTLDWPTHSRSCRDAARITMRPSGPRAAADGFIPILEADLSSQADLLGRPQPPAQPADDADPPETEEERIESFKFYLTQVYTILRPVMLCIMLSLLWVKLSNQPDPVYATGVPVVSSPSVSVGAAFGSAGNETDTTSFIFALVILGQIILSTVVIAALFYYRQTKFIFGFFVLVVFALLGYFGFILGTTLIVLAEIPFDWISFIFFMWNFAIVGVAVIFYRSPLVVQQGYLIVMSSMMAFSLSQLPDLVTWILLALLAAWDLIAVLCPYGPLRILIESSQERGEEIPAALIYSAMVFVMAANVEPTPNSSSGRISNADATTDGDASHTVLVVSESTVTNRQPFVSSPVGGDHAGAVQTPSRIEMQPMSGAGQVPVATASTNPQRPTDQPHIPVDPEAAVEEGEGEEEEEKGVQLGLGDFVFYSVLVGRASLFDWITTVSTTVAVTTGLTATIFILALLRRPLPALPISIAFGILFYFVSSIMLTPQVYRLVQLPSVGSVLVSDASGLWVGKGSGGGMVYA